MTKRIKPIHPGEILDKEFLKPMGITQYRLAKDIAVKAIAINQIVHGKRGISTDMALRLSKYFGVTPEFWQNLQNRYEIEVLLDNQREKLVLAHIQTRHKLATA